MTTTETPKLTLDERRKKRKELGDQLRKLGTEYQERRAAGKDAWPDDTEQTWKRVNTEFDENQRELDQLEKDDNVAKRVEEIRASQEQSQRTGHKPGLDDVIPGENRTFGDDGMSLDQAAEYSQRQQLKRLAFRAWIIGESKPELVTDEMRVACEKLNVRFGQETSINLLPTRRHQSLARRARMMNEEERANFLESGENRALSSFTAGLGPELVPTTFVNMLELAMLANGTMLSYVDTITTSTGEEVKWPTADDTANEGEFINVEHSDTQAGGEPDPVLARMTWNAHQLSSKWIKVPLSLGEDSMFSVEVTLALMLGERLGRSTNRSCTTGDGTKQCRGILLDAPVGATSAAPTAIGYNDIVRLEHSVDPSKRADSAFCMHDTMLQNLRLLKDAEGRPLWQMSMRDGTPDRLHNRPYAYNQHMSDTLATGEDSMLFGKLSDYKLRRVGNVSLVVARERFIELLQIGFLAHQRIDGKLLRHTSDATCGVKKLQQS